MTIDRALLANLTLSPLERNALLMSRDGRRKVFACYLAFREKIAEDFMPLASSGAPFITDHSRTHLDRVLDHVESLLRGNFPKEKDGERDIKEGCSLSWADVLILLNAVVWHDIGNMYGRSAHGRKVRKLFKQVAGHLYDEHMARFICQVCEAHTGPGAIERVIPDATAVDNYHSEDVHLQFLAATLRFADEIDEDNRRARPPEWSDFNVIPAASKRFWFFSKVNSSISLKPLMEANTLMTKVSISSHVPESMFGTRFNAGRRRIRALAEYFRRLSKIDDERVYCSRHLVRAYYHPGIESIEVQLLTNEHGEPVDSGKVFRFEISNSHPPGALLDRQELGDLHEFISEGLEF